MTDFRVLTRHLTLRSGPMVAREAFTLLEMLVALSVASIVLAAALPRINLGRYKVDAALRIAQGTVQQAHRSAIQRQHDVIISFDTASARMHVLYDANNNRGLDAGEQTAIVPLQEGNTFGAPAVGFRGTPTPSVSGPNLTIVGGLPSVIFRRDGASSSGLDVYLRAPGDAARDYRALTVVQSTGRVQRFRYSGTAWSEDGK